MPFANPSLKDNEKLQPTVISCCFFQGEVSTFNAYEKDIAIVNIFFGDSTVFGKFHLGNIAYNQYQYSILSKLVFSEFERSPKMTLLDFISGFGGFCGLCLGFSFVSIVEILYWFSIKLCRNFCQMGRFKNIIGDEGSTAPLITYIAYSAYSISLLALFICLHSGIYAYLFCSTVKALQEYRT